MGPRGDLRQATAAIDPTMTASRTAIPMNRPAGVPPDLLKGPAPPPPGWGSERSGRSGIADALPEGFADPLGTGAPEGIGASCGRVSTGPPVGSKSIQP